DQTNDLGATPHMLASTSSCGTCQPTYIVGLVDIVSAFYTKSLAQPWQAMFKDFNRCLTPRTSGHGQIKINILQIFHAMVNKLNVDCSSLLSWDFIHCVQQKKSVIQYPYFTKLIIADIMSKFKSNPKRLKEDIKDDTLLAYKDYEKEFVRDVEKIVEGEHKESYARDVVESVFHVEEDFDTRIEPMSHKEYPKEIDDKEEEEKKDDKKDDEDDNNDHNDHALIRNKRTGSSETRTEKMQTPIPSPLRSP
nr:hypothetical protein [Tanacetum cinerariifolium]